jgi:proline dehydrogenase
MLNKLITTMMPMIPKVIIKKVALKYIAGYTLNDAVNETKAFEKLGGRTTIDVLGEFVTSKDRALHEAEMSQKVLDAIDANKMPTYLSIKPTSLGLGIDENFGYDNIIKVVKSAKEKGLFVRLDMENTPYTTKTLALYEKIRKAGYDNVGIVIQSYLIRSENDIKSLLEYKPSIRLCKGIYKELPEHAYQGKQEVRDNFKRLLDLIMDNNLKVHIATHDDELINYSEDQIKKRNYPKDLYEFEMLLGVRPDKRNEQLKKGHNVRIYVPFGEDWYGYAIRRVKENPDMAWTIAKAIFIQG